MLCYVCASTCTSIMKCMLMNNYKIISSLISTIMFVDISCEVKMRLVKHNQPWNEIITCKLQEIMRQSNRFWLSVICNFCVIWILYRWNFKIFMVRRNHPVESSNCAKRTIFEVCGFFWTLIARLATHFEYHPYFLLFSVFQGVLYQSSFLPLWMSLSC